MSPLLTTGYWMLATSSPTFSPDPLLALLPHRLHLHRVLLRVIHHRAALVQDLVEPPPGEHEAEDVLPALHDHAVAVDGFEVAAAQAQQALEDVAIAAAELEARAVGDL